MRERENFECKNCGKQFCTKTLFWNHINVCTKRNSVNKDSNNSFQTSILEAHLKNNNQIKKEEPDPILNESNLNIPDFNLFEDINMQLSAQKPIPDLMPISSVKGNSNSKYPRKDSRKVYDESTNTECACEVCGKQWPAKKHLWQHLIRFHRVEAAVTCGVCLKLCQTYEELANHLTATHAAILTGEGNNFTCKICGRYHNARSKLWLHMSIHINYHGIEWCQDCQQGFEDREKLTEHLENCTGKQIEFDDHSNDIDASVQNENDNEDKGSLIDEDNSLMEETEELEFESEAEDHVTENHEDSNSDVSHSDAGTGNTSDEEEDDIDNEEDVDDGEEANEIDDESGTQSRITGDLSSDSHSEDEDSEHSNNDLNEKETNDVSVLSDSNETNIMDTEDYGEDKLQEQGKIVDVIKSPKIENENEKEDHDSRNVEVKLQLHNVYEREFEERPCELQNQALLKEEPGDYLDDEGPPILSPMVPLPVKTNMEDEETNQFDTVQYKLSPIAVTAPSSESLTMVSELDQIRDEIEKSESSWPGAYSIKVEDDASTMENTNISTNNLTEILGLNSDNDQESTELQDVGAKVESEASENEEASGNEEVTLNDIDDRSDRENHNEETVEHSDEHQEDNLAEISSVVDITEDVFDENSNEESDDMEVVDNEDTVQIPNLDGTVLMVANDADGNQILIQRNVSDLPNEDSNPEVTEYILQEDNEYEIDNYDVTLNEEDEMQQSDDSSEVSEEVKNIECEENSIETENNTEAVEDDQISIISAKREKVSRT